MARSRKVIENVDIHPVEAQQEDAVQHSGVETWIPASKVGINTTVVATDERQVINGVEMARCFYK